DDVRLCDPDHTSVRVVFHVEGYDCVCFRFHVSKSACSVIDLKLEIAQHFEATFAQLHLYYRGQVLSDESSIPELPEWQDNGLMRLFTDAPLPLVQTQPLPKLEEASLYDVAQTQMNEAMSSDSQTPAFVNYAARQRDINISINSQGLRRVDAEKMSSALIDQFSKQAISVVEAIAKGSVDAVDLQGLYGGGNDSYVKDGIVVRRVGGWMLGKTSIGDGDAAFEYAALEMSSLTYLESCSHQIDGITVPISASVDFMGERYLCHALVPVVAGKL
ncbi:hypothetical protein KIPB_013439, partial [Kipferlia bialata]